MNVSFDHFGRAALFATAAAPAGFFHDFPGAAWDLRAPGIDSPENIFKTVGLFPGKINNEEETMNDLKNKKESDHEIGLKLATFRKEVMKEFNMTFEEFADNVKIPVARLISYEKGEQSPAFMDLANIRDKFGLSIKWLIAESDNMFLCREGDMDAILEKIRSNENGRYYHYWMLLKSMQVKEMEDYIFQAHQAALNLAAKLDRLLADSQDNIKLLSGMTKGISYVFLKY